MSLTDGSEQANVRLGCSIIAAFVALLLLLGGIIGVVTGSDDSPTPSASAPASVASPSLTTTTTPPPRRVTIPRGLTGINAQRAYDQLQQAGFTNITFGTTDAEDEFVLYPPNWTVTGVEPGGGTQMMSDEPVVIKATKRD